jgi:uncharacterized membrane protein YvbJ
MMADYPSLYSTRDDTQVRPPQRVQPLEPQGNLIACLDCGNPTSRYAESCPRCGRFFQRFQTVVKVDQNGWMSTIAFGILLAAVLPWLIIGIIVLLLVVVGGVGANLVR